MIVGVFKGFLTRAKRICSAKYIQQEIEFLINVSVENGHERAKLESIASTYTVSDSNEPEDDATTTENKDPIVRIPWIPVLGPRIRRAMRRRGVRTVFSSGMTLSDILCNHKSQLPKNSFPGVYRLGCGCGECYIGETKKRVKVRAAEHEKDVFKGRWSNSGATEHAKNCSHQFRWNDVETLCVEPNYRRRKIRESLEIRKHHRSATKIVNREQGNILISTQWDVLIGKLPMI